MKPIRPSRSVYLDTNEFIYAHFYLNKPADAPELDYYRLGEQVVQALERCQERGVRVFSTDLAYLEMHHNYHEWAILKRGLELGAPPGLLFGKGQRLDREFLNRLPTSELHQQVLDATAGWLEMWDFHQLVEFKQPDEIPNWFPIARYIYAHYMETVLDCLHLAAAIGLECDYFLTQDGELHKLVARMRADGAFKRALREEYGLSTDYGLPNAEPAGSFNPPAR